MLTAFAEEKDFFAELAFIKDLISILFLRSE